MASGWSILTAGRLRKKPLAVLQAMDEAYRAAYANVHRGLHYLSNTATENFEAARKTVQGFVNAASDDEIVFTKKCHRGD